MKRIYCLILSLITLLGITSCSAKSDAPLHTRDYIAMDTVFSLRTGDITVDGTAASDNGIDQIFDECEDITNELENALSATKDGADVYSFNTEINVLFDADPILTDVLTTALQISELTGSAYDPTIGALTSLWNVKGGGPVPSEDQIRSALAVSGTDRIEMNGSEIRKSDSSVKLDLGGIGKGYAAQRLAEHLFESGVSYGIVSAGRTVGVFGEKPDGSSFKIGIADPKDPDGVVGYLYTESGFISVAGDYEQYFEVDGVRYHHIMDPETGYPCDSGLSSVAVLSQNGAAADALSTALMVMGYDESIQFYGSDEVPFEAVFIFTDGSVKFTEGLSDDRFVISDSYDPAVSTAAGDVSGATAN